MVGPWCDEPVEMVGDKAVHAFTLVSHTQLQWQLSLSCEWLPTQDTHKLRPLVGPPLHYENNHCCYSLACVATLSLSNEVLAGCAPVVADVYEPVLRPWRVCPWVLHVP
jgi:hypothetical protein